MSTNLIRLATPVLVAGILLNHQEVCAANSESQKSVTSLLSAEVYKAIAELMTLASDIRGDKPDSSEINHYSLASSYLPIGLNNSEVGGRANNLRTAAKLNAQPSILTGNIPN